MTAKGIHMSTLRKNILTIVATNLLFAAGMANASEDATTTTQGVANEGGAYSVDATDRGGRETQDDAMAFEIALFDWLRGLMD
jgi:hypothetical protein